MEVCIPRIYIRKYIEILTVFVLKSVKSIKIYIKNYILSSFQG
jgi:hypothetical protein